MELFDCAKDEPVTPARLERALAAVSYAIVLDGPVYCPVLERLEREIAVHRDRADVMARAHRNVQQLYDQAASASAAPWGVNAIPERYLRLSDRP